jgi:hypothetical protein
VAGDHVPQDLPLALAERVMPLPELEQFCLLIETGDGLSHLRFLACVLSLLRAQ